MAWNESGNGNKNPWGQGGGQQDGPPDLDKIVRDWQRRFGSDPDVVGRTVRIDANAYTVIGILDPAFEHPENIVSAGTEFFKLIF